MKIFKFLCLAAICVAATVARADTFLNTLAWTRYIPVSYGQMTVDELGNTYVAYTTNDMGSGTFAVHFIRYDLSGNASAVSTAYTQAGSGFPVHVDVTPVVNGKRFVYVLIRGSDSKNSTFIGLAKLTDAGGSVWTRYAATNTSNQTVAPLSGGLDSAGNYYIADDFQGPLNSVDGTRFQSICYDPAGNLIHYYFDTTINAASAHFVQGRWIIDGTKNVSPGYPRWVAFDPTNGTEYGQVDYPSVSNSTYLYSYGIQSTTDSAGFVYLLVKVSQYRNSDGSFVAINHFIRKYSASGGLLWTSKAFADDGLGLRASTYGSPLWLTTYGGSGIRVEQFDSNGNQLTSTSPFEPFTMESWYLLPDPTGVYLLYTDAAVHKRLDVLRLGSAGTALWNLSTTTSLGTSTSISAYINYLEANGNLYTLAVLPLSFQIVVQRYVRGTTISSISGGTVSSNSSIVLKVSMNAAAPAGGLSVNMTSTSAKLLFPNNATSYTLAIPAGSIYANVTMHSGTITANTSVAVSGNQNGVIRAGAVTLIP